MMASEFPAVENGPSSDPVLRYWPGPASQSPIAMLPLAYHTATPQCSPGLDCTGIINEVEVAHGQACC